MSKASRDGSTSLSAAPRKAITASRSCRCCARRRTRSIARGSADPSELADGFPTKAEDLFKYQAIIIGSVEAGYFTPVQQELLREFVDKRGGGVLFLGGRFSLSDGGWPASSLTDLFPTFLPSEKGTFHRDGTTVELTAAGIGESDHPAAR